jgi:hypothetical protein
MLTWKVAAATTMSIGTVAGAPATQTIWVKGTLSGLTTPSLPAPSFQLKGINKTEGARNDASGVVATTSLALTQNPQSCPYTPMFYYDAGQPPVPAAGYYIISSTGQVEPDSDPAYQKYTIMNGGNTYFRAPTFPGLKYVQIPATRAGQQLNLWGTGFAGGYPPTDEKVYFHLQGTDANWSPVSREIEPLPAFAGGPLDERQINVVSPDPASLGLAFVAQAAVYVTRAGRPSASLPISYYVTVTTPVPGASPC